MTKQSSAFYKYRAFNTYTLESLCNDTLYFAIPGEFNDPLDCKPTLKNDTGLEELRDLLWFLISRRISTEVNEAFKVTKHANGLVRINHADRLGEEEANRELTNIAYEATNPEYGPDPILNETAILVDEIERELLRRYGSGVFYLSTIYDCPLLWSHYGDQHKGLCIGYGTERNPIPQPQKVVYSEQRTIKTSALIKAFIDKDKKAKAKLDRDVLLRKAPGWKYENEFRLIDTQGVQNSPLLLKEITFGLRCSHSVMHSVMKALDGRENDVLFYKIYSMCDSYQLRRKFIDTGVFDGDYRFPRTAASGAELFDEHLANDTDYLKP